MLYLKHIFFLSSLFIQLTLGSLQKRDYTKRQYYALHSNMEEIRELVSELGGTFEGQVGELSNYFWISFPNDYVIPSNVDIHKSERLAKRNAVVDYKMYPQVPSRRIFKRLPPPPSIVDEAALLGDWKPNGTLPSLREFRGFHKIKKFLEIDSPRFDLQWHLINRLNIGNDLNVTGVWSQGITGKGVAIAILDDGLDMNHNDLKANYFPEGSYDFNNHVREPRPRLNDDTHGTRCAGEIASVKNGKCGVGVAYDAKVAGIRILSAALTEADEAAAINYAFQKNDIYSCSWGPPDTGDVAQEPSPIVMDAFRNGVNNGRNGSGSIFVYATGNGGTNDDNCNFDGYTNSIYTVTVGAIDRLGQHPAYAESCSAQLMVAYSSGKGSHISTTTINNQCTDTHGGTSAAAPLAAGVLALVLSVRPDLSWRDIQHLCVQSATPFSLNDPDWADLPSGRKFNHKFGYGVIDAYKIVEMAKTFKNVREQTSLEIKPPITLSERINDITPRRTAVVNKDNAYKSYLNVTSQQMKDAQISRVEHVTVTVNIDHQRRGDLEIYLESPNGVISQLATARKRDESKNGFKNWTFMTVKHWEENPVGTWTLRVVDQKNPQYTGVFHDWKMTLWGEKTPAPAKHDTVNKQNSAINISSNKNSVKVNIKPNIELHRMKSIDHLKALIFGEDYKRKHAKFEMQKETLNQLETLTEKIKGILKKEKAVKQSKAKNINEEQDSDEQNVDAGVSKDDVQKVDSKERLKELFDVTTLIQGIELPKIEVSKPQVEHNIIDDQEPIIAEEVGEEDDDINESNFRSSGIQQLDYGIGSSNAFLGEGRKNNHSLDKSTHFYVLLFALLITTVICTLLIIRKYTNTSGKINDFMNTSSQNNREVRQLLIQPNEDLQD